jgi:arylsulfatase A-like enzyme
MITYPLTPRTAGLAGLAFAIAAAACSDGDSGGGATARARNVVVIVADDLGYADVSTYAPGRIPTPNIDRIGNEGVRFTDGYVTASVCSPSRAGLLTGRYQQRFGFEFNAGGDARAHEEHLGLHVGEQTLGDRMRDAGLRTAAIGKWHQGSQPEFYPTERGFDEFFGFLTGQTAFIDPDVPGVQNAEAPGGGVIIPRSAYGERGQIVRGPDREVVANSREYLTEELTREAVAFLERNRDQPFFLYLAHHAPHLPFQATQPYYDRFPDISDHAQRVYAAMVSALDDGVGTVLDTLDALGLADDTLVVFLSDNGCATYTNVCACEPVRGGKLTYYEGGVRVPLVMRWPGGLPEGLVYEEPVSALDVLPTALAAIGARLPGDRALDGVDLGPFLRGERAGSPHEALFWRIGPMTAMREGPWKTWRSREGAFSYLFDLEADRNELENLVDRRPDVLQRLEQTYAEWEEGLVPPAWDPRPAPVPACGEAFNVPF